MPQITSKFVPSPVFRNGHFSTIYSAKIRPKANVAQERERFTFKDGDFVDIDWSFSEKPTKKLAILLHGLEGNAQRTYMKGQALALVKNDWDVAGVNYRGCSGEPNLLFESYNAGKTKDLKWIIELILEKDRYDEIALIGFSLGGNLLMKYLGEHDKVPRQITKGVAISAPLSLKGSLDALSRSENWIYRTKFLHDLRKKYKDKIARYPEQMNTDKLGRIKSLLDFDNIYTAPAHGFKDANDYYQKNSSLQFLPKIKQQIFILNAENDSFLSPLCYPRELASASQNIYLETPRYGGHVGYHQTHQLYYSEQRAIDFLNE